MNFLTSQLTGKDAAKINSAITSEAKELIYVIPAVNVGVNGFLFDIVGEETINLESDITDYYIEENSAIQDHIAIRPITVTVKGFIGEVKSAPDEIYKVNAKYAEKLREIQDYYPPLGKFANQFISGMRDKLKAAQEKVTQSSLYEAIKKLNVFSINKQKWAFFYFQLLWKYRVLSVIHTPYRIYTNMAIQSITATQGESTQSYSDFSVTFKQINFAKSLKSDLTRQARREAQSKNVVNNGATQGKPTSIAFSAFKSAFGLTK